MIRQTAYNRLGASTGLNTSQKQEQVFSQTNLVSDYKENNTGEFSNSRSRSPYGEGNALRQTSNSPMRLLQKQQQNSSLLLNANNFSNIKKAEQSGLE